MRSFVLSVTSCTRTTLRTRAQQRTRTTATRSATTPVSQIANAPDLRVGRKLWLSQCVWVAPRSGGHFHSILGPPSAWYATRIPRYATPGSRCKWFPATHSGGETPKWLGRQWRCMYITCGDLSLQKIIFCLATLRSRLLMHGSAVRGLRLIDTSRRDARDLSCLHGRDGASRKVRASANEVKDGGGYGHPLTHEPVFQRDKRIIERSVPTHLNVSFVSVCAVCCVAPARPKPGRSRQIASQPAAPAI